MPLRESPLPNDIDPTSDESNVGQSLALPVLTTSVKSVCFKGQDS